MKKQMELPAGLQDTKTEGSPTVLKLHDVITYMVTNKPISNEEYREKLNLCIDALLDDFETIERVCVEISEDAKSNGVRYFEISPSMIT